MLEFRIPEVGDKLLFEALLEPTDSAVKFVKLKGIGDDKIIRIRGKKNRVAVGVPYCENLIRRLVEEGEDTPREIKKMSNEYDFHLVSLSCSFLPDPECNFAWARFGVELIARSKAGTIHREKPIAYDMFPEEILSKIGYKREISFTPRLKFNIGPVDVDAKPIDATTQKKYTIYEPQMFAFGVNTSKAMWDFKSTEEKGIWGNKRDLLLIARTPKESNVKGRFILAAEVKSHLAKLIPVPIARKKDRIVDAEWNLSE
ncbi:MAG: hypothetical protein PVF15_07945 [Candidatus Bathyarchaeota archaeon]|jgi:hypothetical protein